MNLPIRQRAGHEPRTHFDTTELRLTGIDSPSFAELNRTYQYDKALNTIAANDEIEDLKFVVNGNNQITRVISQYQTRENYYYDQNGYISQQYIHTEDYRYNDGDARGHIAIDNHDLYQQGNRLNRIGNQHYRYDNAGRLIEKTEIQDGFRQKTTYYRWNGNNQLESLTNARGETWYYKYDALGRRTEKACPQQNITTRYLWDGDQVAYQETERHGKTESKRHSIFNGWELIAQQDGYQKQDLRSNRKQWTQTTGYAVCQPNGQPLALFNPQGKRTWRKAPNSLWGLPLLSSWERKQAEPLNPNLLFAGQYTDDESELAYNRFRYYDPQSGNYLASDPIGLNGGETPYAYVHNPMGWVDPKGLSGCANTSYQYDMVNNPGPLAELRGNPASNFAGGKYNSSVLTEDMVLYRAGKAGGGKNALGQWFTRQAPLSEAQVRIDTAVKPHWTDRSGNWTGSSPIESVYAIKIPKGTTIYEGPVGYQGGVYLGGQSIPQIFVQEPWNIKGIEVLSESPIFK